MIISNKSLNTFSSMLSKMNDEILCNVLKATILKKLKRRENGVMLIQALINLLLGFPNIYVDWLKKLQKN